VFDRDLLRTLLSLGALIGFGGLALTFFQPAGSAEQIVSVCSALIGLALILVVLLAARFQGQRGGEP
jgi:hypothetical protein